MSKKTNSSVSGVNSKPTIGKVVNGDISMKNPPAPPVKK